MKTASAERPVKSVYEPLAGTVSDASDVTLTLDGQPLALSGGTFGAQLARGAWMFFGAIVLALAAPGAFGNPRVLAQDDGEEKEEEGRSAQT